MKSKTILMAFLAICTFSLKAQQALWGGAPIVSPEVNEDKTVTFRFMAPKADSVFVTGDFLPTEKV